MKRTSLTYKNYTLPIIQEKNQDWVTSSTVAKALGYSNAERISQIYRRRKNEFTPNMTTTFKLKGVETRVFTLRGVHLLSMFSGTKVAESFRRWVLDVLEERAAHPLPSEAPVPLSPPAGPDPRDQIIRHLTDIIRDCRCDLEAIGTRSNAIAALAESEGRYQPFADIAIPMDKAIHRSADRLRQAISNIR